MSVAGSTMMRSATILAALILGLAVEPVAATSEAARHVQASCPTDLELAGLVAGSDLVLIGRMEVTKQLLLEESQKQSPDYLNIPIRVDGVLKGADVENATVRFYPKDAPYKPSNNAVFRLAGEPAILFLTRVEDGPLGLYFAGYSPYALKPATDHAIGAVRAEVSRQTQIIRSWRANATLPLYGEVQALIARLSRVSGDEQQRVFDRLEALGDEAVPAIIAQMDDRRPLRTQAISLVNHAPDAFERMRHYGPEQVVDGLDAVLNQITGASFGSIVNGGSDRQRAATIAGWRVYAADLACRTSG